MPSASSPTVKFAEPSRYDTFSDGEYSETSYERRSRGRPGSKKGSRGGNGKTGAPGNANQTTYYILYAVLGVAVLALLLAIVGFCTKGFGLMEEKKGEGEVNKSEKKEGGKGKDGKGKDDEAKTAKPDPKLREEHKNKKVFDPNPKYAKWPAATRAAWILEGCLVITLIVLVIGYSGGFGNEFAGTTTINHNDLGADYSHAIDGQGTLAFTPV